MRSDFWQGRNVLITGAGGFKGSHMARKLADAGANVISLIRDYDPRSYFEIQQLGKKSIVVIGDLKNKQKIFDIISKHDIKTIFHFGAQPIVTTALINPIETLESNIMGTVNVLEAARRIGGVTEIIIISSDKAYGPQKIMPYKEDSPLQGRAPYDVSKSCADLIAQMYSNVYNMPVVITRCANVFGPGDLNMSRLIPGLIKAIITKTPFEIRSDGQMTREYIYVEDAIEAYICLAENIEKTKGEAFNVSGKNIMNVLDVVRKVSEILGKSVDTRVLNISKAEIREQWLDGNKIKNILGWEPMTSFEDAIKKTYQWYEPIFNKNFNLQ